MKITIINNWGTNKGDRAVLQFIINRIEEIDDITTVYISSSAPEVLEKHIKSNKELNFIPFAYNSKYRKPSLMHKILKRIRFYLFKYYHYPCLVKKINNNDFNVKGLKIDPQFADAVNNSDIIIGTGGHHITSMREKNIISFLTYDIGIALCFNKPIYLWSQTIGPLEFSKKKYETYIKKIIESVSVLFLREKESINLLKEKEIALNNVQETYDSVFGLYNDYVKEYKPKEKNKVGMAVFNANKRSKQELENYIFKMAEIVKYFKNNDYKVVFFPMESDKNEIELIKQIIYKAGENIETVKIENTNISTKEHILKVSACQLFIGHKTHSIIFSLITKTPLIAISYHNKTDEFMKMFNLFEYVVYEDTPINEMIIKIKKLIKNQQKINEDMELINKKYASKVISDFRNIFENEK